MSSPKYPFVEGNRVICKKQAIGYEERRKRKKIRSIKAVIHNSDPRCLTLFIRIRPLSL